MHLPSLPWKPFVKGLWQEVRQDRLSNCAAALAFYLLLALFPAAIFGLSLLPYLPIPRVDDAIMDLVRQALPPSAADLFTGTVQNVASRRGGLLSFGFVFAIWSASKGMLAVMQQLNVVYDVEEERSFLRARATAVVLTLLFCVLVLGALSLVVFGGMVQAHIGDRLGWSSGLLFTFAALRWVIIFGALHLAFALIYHLAPNVEQRFVLITPGSVFATVMLLLASLAFKLYVSNFGRYDAVYGGLGAVIVLLLWLYGIGWVMLLGGEINELTRRSKPDRAAPRTRPGRA